MSQSSGLIGRVGEVARRVTDAPEWPLGAAVTLGLLAVAEVTVRADQSGADLTVVMLLGLGATVPIALAGAHVLGAAVVITFATFLTLAALLPLTGAGLVALLAVLHVLGRNGSRWATAVLVLPFVAYAIAGPFDEDVGDRLFAVLLAGLTVAAAGLGRATKVRREAAELEASRHIVAGTLLEHAARGERARIARELHDVVAHHISMIAVQAETARLATSGMPPEGAKRLLAIGDTARAALTEMRRLVGVLREDAGTESTRQPQPGLHQLIELVDEARESTGASTRLIVRGRVGPLDPGVELTAYRIVQEALTNARRHAPGAAVDIELDFTDDALHVRVRDNGPGPPENASTPRSPADGHGLLGMRERAAAVGGTLWTGPAQVSGFLVEARLPAARLVVARAAE
ncbi:MAG: sensor histidine kinase [Jiangellaceae bacterium]